MVSYCVHTMVSDTRQTQARPQTPQIHFKTMKDLLDLISDHIMIVLCMRRSTINVIIHDHNYTKINCEVDEVVDVHFVSLS